MPNDIQTLLNGVGLPTTFDLTRFVRAIPDPAEWTLSALLPFNEIQSVKWKTSTLATTISAAKFRAWDAQVPLGRRVASRTETEGLLPPLGIKTMIGEFETILLQLQRGSNSDELVEAIYDQGQSNALAIRARWELARGDLLTDFKFSLVQENGLTLDADFVAPAGHLPTAAILWDQALAVPIDNELAWVSLLTTDSLGAAPDVRYASQRVINTLATNAQYRQAAYPGVDIANVPNRITNGQVNAVRAQWGLPPITPYDVQIDVDGVLTRPIPDDRFVMTTSTALGQSMVGITAESLALTNAGNPRLDGREAPGIVATRYVQDDPVSMWVRANAVGMPVLADKQRLITAKVL